MGKIKIGKFNIDFWKDSESPTLKGGRPEMKLDVEEVRRLRAQGLSLRQLGDHFDCSKDKIAKVLKNGH